MRKGKDMAGQALILVLMIVGVALVVSSTLAALGTGAVRVTRAQVDDMKAYYIAEAGMEAALAQLKLQPSWDGFKDAGGSDRWVAYGGGEYRIEIPAFAGWMTPEGEVIPERVVTVVATGRYPADAGGAAQKTLIALVTVRLHDAVWRWPGLFVDGTGTVTISGSADLEITDVANEIPGNVFVRGSLTISGNGELKGDNLFVANTLRVEKKNKLIMKEVRSGAFAKTTSPPHDTYQNILDNDPDKRPSVLMEGCPTAPDLLTPEVRDCYLEFAGDASFPLWNQEGLKDASGIAQLDGIYRCVGPLELTSGTYTGHGVIIATGNVSLVGGNAKLLKKGVCDCGCDSTPSLTIISPTGTVVLSGSQELGANIVANTLSLSGNPSVFGIAMVQDVTFGGGGGTTNFQFDSSGLYSGGNDMGFPGTTVTVGQWREKHGIF